MPNHFSLIDSSDSVLIAIDVQPAFLDKLPAEQTAQLLTNICWLTEVAAWVPIPIVVTAEEYTELPLAPQLLDVLSRIPNSKVPIFNKLTFGLADQPDILAAIEETGRKTAVLVGLETDVCVMHSALGLLDRGYRVAVVTDAVGTPNPHHTIGLERMRSAGVLLVNRKGLFYEWLRTVEMVNRFHQENPRMREMVKNDL